MTERANERAIWIQPEATFNTDPTSGDAGATSIYVDAWDLQLPESLTQLLPYQLGTGRPRKTSGRRGARGATVSFKIASKGKATAAGSGTNMSTVALDVQSHLLASALQARATTAGGTIGAGSTTSNLVVGTDIANATDLAYIYGSGYLTPDRGAWGRIASNTSPYSINPTWETAPRNLDIAYGLEMFRPPTGSTFGASLTAIIVAGATSWVCTGGRVIKMVCVGKAGQIIYWDVTIRFNSWSRATRASRPAAAPSTLGELVCENSRVAFGDITYEVAEFEFDMGIKDRDRLATGAAQGRSNILPIDYEPKIKLVPEYANAWEDDGENKTSRTVLLSCGAGVLSGGAVNTLAIWAEAGQVIKAGLNDDQNIMRHAVEIDVVDPHYPAALPGGTTLGDYFLVARA